MKGFFVYHDNENIVNQLSDKDRGKLFSMLIAYSERGELPDTDNLSISIVFSIFKKTIDLDKEKYEKKCKINRSNGSKGGKKKSERYRTQANATERKRTLPNATDKNGEKIKEIVSYLNEKAGTNYRPTTDSTKRHIIARFNEGFVVEDFKKVIDNKVQEWKNSDFAKFLRPETLFGAKFESYLNKPAVAKKKNDCSYDLDELMIIK